jgi:hydrogenase maturation factor
LKLLGSGALLIVADPNKVRDLVYALKEMEIEATIIGEILPDLGERILLRRDGSRVTLEAVKQDHLYKILDKHRVSEKST